MKRQCLQSIKNQKNKERCSDITKRIAINTMIRGAAETATVYGASLGGGYGIYRYITNPQSWNNSSDFEKTSGMTESSIINKLRIAGNGIKNAFTAKRFRQNLAAYKVGDQWNNLAIPANAEKIRKDSRLGMLRGAAETATAYGTTGLGGYGIYRYLNRPQPVTIHEVPEFY